MLMPSLMISLEIIVAARPFIVTFAGLMSAIPPLP